jgi:glycosyltransferase involved in cell wall biosynthesis
MLTICLVTNEIYPVTHGGCGTLIFNSVYSLLRSNFRVLLLVDIDSEKFKEFELNHLSKLPNLINLEIYCLSRLLPPSIDEVGSKNQILRQSWRFYKGILLLINSVSIDVIEIPDYLGYGYYTLLNRSDLPKNTKIYIRFHLTMEWIDQAVPQLAPIGENRILTYGLERWCLKEADCVLAPTLEVANKVQVFYQPKQVLVSQPSLAGLEIISRKPLANRFRILFYARLAPQKGADIFVSAAIEWLKGLTDISQNIRFTIAGPDMNGGPGYASMALYLRRLVPVEFQKYFEFLGNLDRQALDLLLPTVLFATFPTRSETYCYAARELAMAGVPLICSDIPELSDLVNEGLAVSASLNVYAWKQAINQQYNKYHFESHEDKYWTPIDSLPDAYNIELTVSIQAPKPTREEIFVLFFIFSTKNRKSDTALLEQALANVLFNYKIVIAFKDEEGAFPLRNKRWRLSADIPDRFNVLCFVDVLDVISADYLNWAIETFKNDSSIAIITCDCSAEYNGEDGVPWHVAPSLLPFKDNTVLKRALLRMDNESKNICFDPFMLELNEISGILKILQRPESKWLHTTKWNIDAHFYEKNDNSSNIAGPITSLLIQDMREKKIPLLDSTLIHLLMNSRNTVDIPCSLLQGRTPEVGGIRYNVTGILKLLLLRLLGIRRVLLSKLRLL